MFINKTTIINYHDDLINRIDLFSENKLFKMEQNNDFDSIRFGSARKQVISYIEQVKKNNLDILKSRKETKRKKFQYCYFIPNEDKRKYKWFDVENNFGHLLITEIQLSDLMMNRIIDIKNRGMVNRFNRYLEIICYQNCSESNANVLTIIIALLDSNKKNIIIDSTKQLYNILEKLNLKYYEDHDNGLEFLPGLIDIQKIKEVEFRKVYGGKIYKKQFYNIRHAETLSFNSSRYLILFKNNFKHFENLTKLSINVEHHLKLKPKCFNGLRNLKELNLAKSGIHQVRRKFLYGLDNLEILDLGENQITKIDRYTFIHTKNLIKLNLSNNKIKYIHNDFLLDLPNLKVLGLGYNEIRSIPTSLVTCQNLESLDLNLNKVESFDLKVLKSEMIKYLALRENKILDVKELNRFEYLECLDLKVINQNLNINDINIQNLAILIFNASTKIPKLNENFKSLKGLEITGVTGFEQDCFQNLNNLDYLSLYLRDISVLENIDNDDLKYIQKLKFISIDLDNEKSEEKRRKLNELFQKKKTIFRNLLLKSQDIGGIQDKYQFDSSHICKGIYFEKILNVSKVTIESIFFDRMLKSWLWQDSIAFAYSTDEIYRVYYATLLSIEPGRCCLLALTRYSVGHKEETCFNTPPKLPYNFKKFKEWVN